MMELKVPEPLFFGVMTGRIRSLSMAKEEGDRIKVDDTLAIRAYRKFCIINITKIEEVKEETDPWGFTTPEHLEAHFKLVELKDRNGKINPIIYEVEIKNEN
jgi:hypothetical protein